MLKTVDVGVFPSLDPIDPEAHFGKHMSPSWQKDIPENKRLEYHLRNSIRAWLVGEPRDLGRSSG